MVRATNAVARRRRHKKWLKLAKGYRGMRSRSYKVAKDAVIKALAYAYVGRKRRKRDFRRLWNARINAASRARGMNYSRFINALRREGIALNRKMLALIASEYPQVFDRLVEEVKK